MLIISFSKYFPNEKCMIDKDLGTSHGDTFTTMTEWNRDILCLNEKSVFACHGKGSVKQITCIS